MLQKSVPTSRNTVLDSTSPRFSPHSCTGYAMPELALFDFDHTITHGDSFATFVRRIATPKQLRAGRWTVGPWLLGYRLRLVNAAQIRARVTRLAFAGRDAAEIAAAARDYAERELPQLVLPLMLEQIQWHRQHGHTVVVISASLDLYLQPWCEQYGLALISNRLHSDNGRLSGRYAEPDIGPRKVELIRRSCDLRSYRRIHAYGDSKEDLPMLALAHERWYRGALQMQAR